MLDGSFSKDFDITFEAKFSKYFFSSNFSVFLMIDRFYS